MSDEKLFHRLLDVVENDIAPLTAAVVETGSRVFGAAVLRRADLSLVLAETSHAAFSPLWHGEIYTMKLFFELQGHPDPDDCVFLSTHQPCCMCASALAWSGFREIYYLFDYGRTREDFNMPHDLMMNREIFGCNEPRAKNRYFEWKSLCAMIDKLPDPAMARARVDKLAAIYAHFAKTAEEKANKSIKI
ncbi:MAG: nucleoside deaminase [Synergistaceae bacterium]|jgi:tRNA(Arg) A34 adenosine deaminase TadA|nr:nucleoside deaminase [Synergistaceae bacterium]